MKTLENVYQSVIGQTIIIDMLYDRELIACATTCSRLWKWTITNNILWWRRFTSQRNFIVFHKRKQDPDREKELWEAMDQNWKMIREQKNNLDTECTWYDRYRSWFMTFITIEQRFVLLQVTSSSPTSSSSLLSSSSFGPRLLKREQTKARESLSAIVSSSVASGNGSVRAYALYT